MFLHFCFVFGGVKRYGAWMRTVGNTVFDGGHHRQTDECILTARLTMIIPSTDNHAKPPVLAPGMYALMLPDQVQPNVPMPREEEAKSKSTLYAQRTDLYQPPGNIYPVTQLSLQTWVSPKLTSLDAVLFTVSACRSIFPRPPVEGVLELKPDPAGLEFPRDSYPDASPLPPASKSETGGGGSA